MNYTNEEQERRAWLAGDYERVELHEQCEAGENYGAALDWEDPERVKTRLEEAEGEVVSLEEERDSLEADRSDLRQALEEACERLRRPINAGDRHALREELERVLTRCMA